MAAGRVALRLALCCALARLAFCQSPTTDVSQAGILIAPEPLNPGVGDQLYQIMALAAPPQIPAAPANQITRYFFVLGVAGYEAFAAYDPTAVGLLFGRRFKRPAAENTFANKRLAAVYAIYTAELALYGAIPGLDFSTVQGVLASFGLDPAANTTDVSTGIGLGRVIGLAIAEYFLNDNYNELGDEDAQYNGIPFQEVPPYVPRNTAYELRDRSRWQPLRVVAPYLTNYVQEFNGAAQAYCPPFTYKSPSQWGRFIHSPNATRATQSRQYYKQAADLVNKSAHLDDYSKTAAVFSQGLSVLTIFFVANKYNWTLDDQIKANFLLVLSFFDANIATFYYKARYDAIRPISVIRNTGLFKKIEAWGGPYNGTVEMDARDWQPYLGATPAEPEYPSTAVCRDAAVLQALSEFVGTAELGWTPVAQKGLSYIELGFAPTANVQLDFPTFASVVDFAALGQQTGGYHFKAATDASKELCAAIGSNVFRFATELFAGRTPAKLG